MPAETGRRDAPRLTPEPASGGETPAAPLIGRMLRLLLGNGQTTERAVITVQGVGRALGRDVDVLPGWECTWMRTDPGGGWEAVAAPATGIDMHKVAATMHLADALSAGRVAPEAGADRLAAIEALPPVSLARFALLAALGAMALAVVFGAVEILPIAMVGGAAGLGAVLRRRLAGLTGNLFLQPFAAATLAGLAGCISLRGWIGTPSSLVALCPCMVLVPGPHLLNGALDLIRGRLPMGCARLVYAGLVLLAISTGLMLGLALGGTNLPGHETVRTVPLALDVTAAGVAVLAYGTFFAMAWRDLPVSVTTGMLAHAIHWLLLTEAQATIWFSAFVSCLLVGIVMSRFTDRANLPYAGCAFASVVSLIPGAYVFRMADALLTAAGRPPDDAVPLLAAAAQDGTVALATFVAMASGLLLPRLLLATRRSVARDNKRGLTLSLQRAGDGSRDT